MRMVVATVLGLVAVDAGLAGSEEWARRYPVGSGAELHLKVGEGSVRVETGDAEAIEVRVTAEGRSIGPGGLKVTEGQTGDRVDVDVSLASDAGGHAARGTIEVAVRVPSRAIVEVRAGEGELSADGVRGEIQLHSRNGSIKAKDLVGRVRADTGNGDLRIRGRFDSLHLRTASGDIDAEIAPGSTVAVPWSVDAGDGEVTLHLPADLAANLDARTDEGEIALDRSAPFTGSVNESRLRAVLGGGGPPLKVHTGRGTIRLLGL
jgi:hypothetical protein